MAPSDSLLPNAHRAKPSRHIQQRLSARNVELHDFWWFEPAGGLSGRDAGSSQLLGVTGAGMKACNSSFGVSRVVVMPPAEISKHTSSLDQHRCRWCWRHRSLPRHRLPAVNNTATHHHSEKQHSMLVASAQCSQCYTTTVARDQTPDHFDSLQPPYCQHGLTNTVHARMATTQKAELPGRGVRTRSTRRKR